MFNSTILRGLPLPTEKPANRFTRFRFDDLRHGDAFDTDNPRSVFNSFYRWRKTADRPHARLLAYPGKGDNGTTRVFFVDEEVV